MNRSTRSNRSLIEVNIPFHTFLKNCGATAQKKNSALPVPSFGREGFCQCDVVKSDKVVTVQSELIEITW